MRVRYPSLLFVLLFVLPSTTGVQLPLFEASDCWFGSVVGKTVECGYVIVPADRTNASDPTTLKIAVAVFRGSNEAADPVIFLSGGPGSKTVGENAPALAALFQPVYGERDFILFDQRGVGISEPALECPQWLQAVFEGWNEPDPVTALQHQFAVTTACGEQLAETGYDLSAFNTTQSAADVNDIRIALGYERVNLFGVSYGTMLAQAVMRDYPDTVRSALLDSVMPIDRSVFVDTITSPSDTLLKLVDACAADNRCNGAYPDLRAQLFATIDRLNGSPAPLVLTDSVTGQRYDYLLTGDAFAANLKTFLYQAPFLPLIPEIISQVGTDDYTLLTQLSSAFLPAYAQISRGMMFSVFCTEDVVGRTPESMLDQINTLPRELRGRIDPAYAVQYSTFGLCEHWPVRQSDPSVKSLVSSDIPTLIVSGEYDPVTPPEGAQRVAERLSRAYTYEFPAIGHNVNAFSPCAQQISAAFVIDPADEPDASCVAALPSLTFHIPIDGLTIISVDG